MADKENLLWEFMVTMLSFFLAVLRGIWKAIGWVPQKSLSGEMALITGGGSGIGRLLALELAAQGATIILWDVNTAGNEETANMVKSRGGKAQAYTVDISSRDNVYKAAEVVKKEVGQVTLLINNAGIVSGKKLLDSPDDMILKTFDVNVLAHFWITRAFLPAMLKRNHGHIVNMASIAGMVGCNGLADYCASKFADVGFTESLDLEIAAAGAHDVHTTLVCPYYIATGMFEGCQSRFPWILPILDPDYVAKKIIKAIRTNQRQLYIPKIMYLLVIIKSILPVEAQLILHKFLGAANFMDTFVGRQQKNK